MLPSERWLAVVKFDTHQIDLAGTGAVAV